MKRKQRKAFTIVELVIVIAVIGVLTAVLIPTFVNLTNKAQLAENQTFVKNINTQLAINEAEEGKNKTAHEAIMDAFDMGFDVRKLTPVNGNDIIWDEENDRFAIVAGDFATNTGKDHVIYADAGFKTGEAAKPHKLWKLYESMPDTQNYSIYAKGDWSGAVGTQAKPLTVGFDAGENTGITSVYYATDNNNEAVIRTSDEGTALVVNAPNATVHHYNFLESLDIEDIDANSYHEHGQVRGKVTLKAGRFVMEDKSSVGSIDVIAENAQDFSIEQKGNSEVGFVTATNPEVLNTTGDNKNVTVKNENSVQTSGDTSAILYNSVHGFWSSATAFPTEGTTTFLKDMDYRGVNNLIPNSYNDDWFYLVGEGKSTTIDLNGHTVNFSGLYVISGNSITIQDSASAKGLLDAGNFQLGQKASVPDVSIARFENCKVNLRRNMLIFYAKVDIVDAEISGYITVNGTSTYSDFQNPRTSITAVNSSFSGPSLYLAGYGNYVFDNCSFNSEGTALYFKAGGINVTNCTFDVSCSNGFKYDYISYSNGSFDVPGAIMIDEHPDYKGYGDVKIGSGNSFIYTGDHASDYIDVMYNLIPESDASAHVELDSSITSKVTLNDFVAKREVSFTYISDNKVKSGTCTVYFVSVERANAFTAADFPEGKTVTELGEVIEL